MKSVQQATIDPVMSPVPDTDPSENTGRVPADTPTILPLTGVMGVPGGTPTGLMSPISGAPTMLVPGVPTPPSPENPEEAAEVNVGEDATTNH